MKVNPIKLANFIASQVAKDSGADPQDALQTAYEVAIETLADKEIEEGEPSGFFACTIPISTDSPCMADSGVLSKCSSKECCEELSTTELAVVKKLAIAVRRSLRAQYDVADIGWHTTVSRKLYLDDMTNEYDKPFDVPEHEYDMNTDDIAHELALEQEGLSERKLNTFRNYCVSPATVSSDSRKWCGRLAKKLDRESKTPLYDRRDSFVNIVMKRCPNKVAWYVLASWVTESWSDEAKDIFDDWLNWRDIEWIYTKEFARTTNFINKMFTSWTGVENTWFDRADIYC